ncbi:MarR family winged helix-turn-helix transcriptional regulator [Streptomyces orinoci]|uniref:MarR family transcriptional regulator n=1 Tax=Streptomyces orinoci TaxID=67339 RepID=A0ABV3K0Z8_STRON|nr:MarR family transcriptional regulator [Streptomyces orinoci]
MSSEKQRAAAELAQNIAAYQAAVDDFDREVARLFGVNETDLRCLEILMQETKEAAPKLLATRLGLTTGSTTTLLDRLEKAGYITRSPHPTDRRKTIVRATEQAERLGRELYAPLIEEGSNDLLTRYSVEQIEVITDFLSRTAGLQQRHTQRLRALPSPTKTAG